jgi:protein-tyrosine phosphatase
VPPPYRIAFVCLGNICRSPIAEYVMRQRLDDAGLGDRVTVTSAGTGDYHVGEGADPRTVTTLRTAGLDASGHRAVQFTSQDFAGNDLVVAMDAANAADLRRIAPDADAAAKVVPLRSYDADAGPDDLDVPDPYFGGGEGFPLVLEMVQRACDGLLAELNRTAPDAAR